MTIINKDTIIAEIERRISMFSAEKAKESASVNDKLSLGGRIAALEEFKVFINGLEVKDTDLEKKDKNLKMLLDAIDYSFLQTDGSYDKSLTYPVIDKVLFIKKSIN